MHSDHDSDSIVEVSPLSPSSGSTACESSSNKDIVTRRSTYFYFSNVIFQVEDALYNVPRQPFMRESDVFHDLFSLPTPVGRKAEGQSDEEPVLLQSVSKVDFERLLCLLFPDVGIDFIPTTEEWLSILKLATLWDMPKVRERAIRHMTPLLLENPVQKIEIAREYDIDDWMLPALNQLVQRDQPLTVEEGERLGMEYTTKLASIRECCRFNNRTYRWELGRSRGCMESNFDERLREVFNNLSIRSVAI